MESKNNKRLLIYLVCIFAIFLIAVFRLDFLGEGAHHAKLAQSITAEGTLDSSTTYYYPGIYETLSAALVSVSGIDSLKILSPIAIGLIALLSYVFVKKLENNPTNLPMLVAILVFFSAKLLRYGIEPLIEVPQTFLILLTTYFITLKPSGKKISFLYLVLLTAIAGFKQQGLIVTSSLLLIWSYFNYRNTKKLNIWIYPVFGILVLAIYVPMIYRTGVLLEPSSREYVSIVEEGEQSLIQRVKYPLINETYKESGYERALYQLTSDKTEKLESGTSSFEAKHLPLFKQLTSLDSWLRVNSLYTGLIGIFLLLIVIYDFANGNFSKINESQKRFLLSFTLLWLFSQAFILVGGYGTEKYFIFIPVYFLLLSMLSISSVLESNAKKKIYRLFIWGILAVIIVSGALRISTIPHFNNNQSYTPSVGGLSSIQEVASIIDNQDYEKIIVPSTYEWRYYSDAEFFADSQIYFLDDAELIQFIYKYEIDAIIIQDSLVQTGEWTHRGMYPVSFVNRILRNFSTITESTEEDIIIVTF